MPSNVIEPPAGQAGPPEPAPEPPEPLAPPAPAPVPLSSTSGDDLTARLTSARPDPLLGSFSAAGDGDLPAAPSGDVPGGEPAPAGPVPAAEAVAAAVAGESPRGDALNALGHLQVEPGDVAPASDITVPGSAEAFAALDLSASASPPAPQGGAHAPPPRPAAKVDGDHEEDDDEDDEPPPRGVSLSTLLLASYASAVTFGLLWVLWSGRRLREETGPDFLPPADTRPDPGLRADKSRKVTPPEPIPDDHLTDLGKTIRLGQIEVTPVSVSKGSVRLVHFGGKQTRAGGKDALILRLRLQNVSTDTILAPLDEAFVRDRIGAEPDSFIETGSGEPIPMFPLAVESEWAIKGQAFREIKPGDRFETVVVSTPGAAGKLAPEMTWRVRLRTDINHTDDLGVRFRPDDVKEGS